MKTTLCSALYLAVIGASALLAQPAYFTRMTNAPIATDALRSWGCALVDYDNDGFTDVFVATAFGGNSCLYHNDGNFQFTKVTTEPVVTTFGDFCTGVFGDYDNDGDLDLFASGFDPYKGCFFLNDLGTGGSKVFSTITSGPWVNTVAPSVGAAWADYDNDGFLDLFVSNSSDQDDFLYVPQRWIRRDDRRHRWSGSEKWRQVAGLRMGGFRRGWPSGSLCGEQPGANELPLPQRRSRIIQSPDRWSSSDRGRDLAQSCMGRLRQ